MKTTFCRSCHSKKLQKAFNLGSQKLSGIFPKSANQENISDVIINGEFILKDRKFVNQNEKDVIETAELLGEDLINKSKVS